MVADELVLDVVRFDVVQPVVAAAAVAAGVTVVAAANEYAPGYAVAVVA